MLEERIPRTLLIALASRQARKYPGELRDALEGTTRSEAVAAIAVLLGCGLVAAKNLVEDYFIFNEAGEIVDWREDVAKEMKKLVRG